MASIRISIDLLDDGSVLVPDDAHRSIAEWSDRTGKSFKLVIADHFDDPEILDAPQPRQDSTTHRAIMLPPGIVIDDKAQKAILWKKGRTEMLAEEERRRQS